MGKFGLYILGLIVLVASTEAQRNLQYPTTKRPAPTKPTSTVSPTTVNIETTTFESSTQPAAPYPAAGYRPGRAFELPTEERKVEQPGSSYGPPIEETTTFQSAPYPPAGYRPGRAFELPTEERKVEQPGSSYGPPIEETTTFQSAPYPPAGYRPGRAFELPTEERKVEQPASSYGPPIEETTTPDNAPYPPAGYRPGKAFNLPTEEKKAPDSSYGPPTEKPPYPPSGYRPSRAFNLPTEDDQGRNVNEPGSGYGPPPPTSEFDLNAAGSEISTNIRFPESDSESNSGKFTRVTSGQTVLQTRPSNFHHPDEFVDHRFIRPAQPFHSNRVPNVATLRPGQFHRPIRPLNRPIGGTQSVLQTRPTFGINSGVFFEDDEPILVTSIRLPDPFAFTSFLDDF